MSEKIDFKKFYEYELTYDKSIQYKDLVISPVRMHEYLNYYIAINCLLFKKNNTADTKIISMSYLDYLFYLINSSEDNRIYLHMLYEIFRICCGLKYEEIKYSVDEKGKTKLYFKDIEYNKKDFDEIKRVILYQNSPDYDDSYIDPNLEEAINEANRLSSSDGGESTLEDQIICVMISTPLKIEDIENMTIRKFIKTVKKIDAKLHYQIDKGASMSGMVEFKQPITHWMYSKNNKFSSLINYTSFKKKIESAK